MSLGEVVDKIQKANFAELRRLLPLTAADIFDRLRQTTFVGPTEAFEEGPVVAAPQTEDERKSLLLKTVKETMFQRIATLVASFSDKGILGEIFTTSAPDFREPLAAAAEVYYGNNRIPIAQKLIERSILDQDTCAFLLSTNEEMTEFHNKIHTAAEDKLYDLCVSSIPETDYDRLQLLQNQDECLTEIKAFLNTQDNLPINPELFQQKIRARFNTIVEKTRETINQILQKAKPQELLEIINLSEDDEAFYTKISEIGGVAFNKDYVVNTYHDGIVKIARDYLVKSVKKPFLDICNTMPLDALYDVQKNPINFMTLQPHTIPNVEHLLHDDYLALESEVKTVFKARITKSIQDMISKAKLPDMHELHQIEIEQVGAAKKTKLIVFLQKKDPSLKEDFFEGYDLTQETLTKITETKTQLKEEHKKSVLETIKKTSSPASVGEMHHIATAQDPATKKTAAIELLKSRFKKQDFEVYADDDWNALYAEISKKNENVVNKYKMKQVNALLTASAPGEEQLLNAYSYELKRAVGATIGSDDLKKQQGTNLVSLHGQGTFYYKGIHLQEGDSIVCKGTTKRNKDFELEQDHSGSVSFSKPTDWEGDFNPEDKAAVALKQAEMSLLNYNPKDGPIVIGGTDTEQARNVMAALLWIKHNTKDEALKKMKIECDVPGYPRLWKLSTEKSLVQEHFLKKFAANPVVAANQAKSVLHRLEQIRSKTKAQSVADTESKAFKDDSDADMLEQWSQQP